METLSLRAVRRLALARAGLLKPEWTAMPRRATGGGARARRTAAKVIDRFGYLQLDTVSIAGARSHVIVLMSRLEGFDPALGEELLQPGEPLFEYWGHEASWLPMELYPALAFRRSDYRIHPWYGDILNENRDLTRDLVDRIGRDGPLRAVELEARGRGWWDMKPIKKVALALWSSGELAIRERRGFQRTYDLAERVIPAAYREQSLSRQESYDQLLEQALAGHGWATRATLAATWRLKATDPEVEASLRRLEERGLICACALVADDNRRSPGWVRPADLELADRLLRCRPRRDRCVLLSPFDPVLWDRSRVARLFDFDQVLEIYKPAARRRYGYYCLPVLAGEDLVARVDLKAERKKGRLRVLSCRHEVTRPSSQVKAAVTSAVKRFAAALKLEPMF